jgi:DNA polymerase-3 subunit gamma/tau
MSYQVLARKWRPRNFDSLVGQEHVVRALRHALDQNRLHHAYLFSGTRGVGKTTLARILAKALNCETGVSSRPCGKCSSCTEIDAGRFVDLIEVDAATNTKVDEMRQLLENSVYAPTRGRFKVYVIDEVHMLSASAFNAMLKTLEEPPEHIKFILATTDPQKIPVTVLSRCLQFNLKQMPASLIAARLADILAEEKLTADGGALALLGEYARGSMRDALSLLDQAIAYGGGGQISEQAVRAMAGAIDDKYLYSILDALARGDAAAVLSVAEEMRESSVAFDGALQELASVLHRVALSQSAPGAVEDREDLRVRLAALAKALDPEDVQLYYQIAIHGRQDLPFAPDEFTGFTMALLRMLAFTPVKRDAGDPGRKAAGEGGSAPESPRPMRSAPAQEAFDGDWPRLANALNLGGVAKQLAQASELKRFDGESFELCVLPAAKHLAEKGYQDKLRGALQDYLGRPVRLTVQVGNTAGNTSRDRAAAAIGQDGFVRDLIENFDATIVESSIKPAQ